jgi:hypothetical protein
MMPKFFVARNYGDGKSSDEVMIESASMRSAAREIFQRDYDIANAAPVAVTLNVRPDRQVDPRSQCRVQRLPDGSIGISQMINREPVAFLHTYGVSIWDEHNIVDVVAVDEREAAKRFVNEHKPPFHMKEPLMLSVKGEHDMRCRKVMAWLTVDGLRAEVISQKHPQLGEADLFPVEEEEYEEYDEEKWGPNIYDPEPGTPSVRTYFVSALHDDGNTVVGDISTVEAPSPKEAAAMYVLQTQSPIPLALGGHIELRVQGEGEPNFDRVTVWTDKDGINARVYDKDSASEAIDNMMKPLPPPASVVSEPPTMTISAPHPWMIFRVYSGGGNEPMLVAAMSMEEALKKAKREGVTVYSIHHVLFHDGVERMDDF